MSNDVPITHISLPVEFVNQLTLAHDVGSTLECIAVWLPQIIQADRASICLDSGDGKHLQVYVLSGNEAIPLDSPIPIDTTMVGRVFTTQTLELASDLRGMDELDCQQLAAGGLTTCMDAPLIKGHVCFGTLNIAHRKAGSYGANEATLLRCLANWVANHLFSNHQLSIQKQLAETDPLTGISNRRSLFHVGNTLMTQWLLNQCVFSLIMIDIDYFKSINDRYGHEAGDRVLKDFCHLVDQHVRDDDEFGRLGGEEFAIILSHSDPETVERLAHRIKLAISESGIAHDGEVLSLTASIGVSQVHDDDDSFEDVLRRADKAMYQSKWRGRNRITFL